MLWWDLNTKSFRRFSAIKKTYWHAGGLAQNLFGIFQLSRKLLTCIDRTVTQTLFSVLQRSISIIDMHWLELSPKPFWRFSAIKNAYAYALVGPWHKSFSAICSHQECLWTINMHWWNLITKSFRRFSAIKKIDDLHWCDLNTKLGQLISAVKNTHWHALVGP